MSGTSVFYPGRKGEKQIPQMPSRGFVFPDVCACTCVCVCVCCEFDRGERAVVEKVAAGLSSDKNGKPGKAGGGDSPGGLGAAFRHVYHHHLMTIIKSN